MHFVPQRPPPLDPSRRESYDPKRPSVVPKSHIDPVARRVLLDGDEAVNARTILPAAGVNWRRLSIEGFDRFVGKGIYYGAARSEADTVHGQDIHLIGVGNSAGQTALFFANHARRVTLVVRRGAVERGMSHYLIEQIRRHQYLQREGRA